MPTIGNKHSDTWRSRRSTVWNLISLCTSQLWKHVETLRDGKKLCCYLGYFRIHFLCLWSFLMWSRWPKWSFRWYLNELDQVYNLLWHLISLARLLSEIPGDVDVASCNAVMIAMERAAEWQMALNLLDLMGKMQVGCVGHPRFRDLFKMLQKSLCLGMEDLKSS